jgi:hypothetical protein
MTLSYVKEKIYFSFYEEYLSPFCEYESGTAEDLVFECGRIGMLSSRNLANF